MWKYKINLRLSKGGPVIVSPTNIDANAYRSDLYRSSGLSIPKCHGAVVHYSGYFTLRGFVHVGILHCAGSYMWVFYIARVRTCG
jgi:hypothetical protein